MRFRPLVHVSADDALQLPDDFAALGEQLSDDARHLAEKYPAPVVRKSGLIVHETIRPRSHGWVRRIAAAAILMLLGGGAAILVERIWSPAGPPASSGVAVKPPQKSAAAEMPGPPKVSQLPVDSPLDSRAIEVREVDFSATPKTGTVSQLSEVEMLRIQLGAFEQVIRKLQDELAKRDQSQVELNKTIDELREEVNQLRTQSASRPDSHDHR